MNDEQARFVAWSVLVGVAAPFVGYLVVTYIAADGEGMAAPIDRGQFYLASLGVLAGVLQRLAVPRPAFVDDARRRNAAEIVKGTVVVAIMLGTIVWTAITVASLTDADWLQEAKGAAWAGAGFLIASCLFGYKSLALLDQ